MQERLRKILDRVHQYNAPNMAELAFGLDTHTVYDALVIAPSYTPFKLKMDAYCKVTVLQEGAYIAGYLVEKDACKIAWIKVAAGDANCIDHMAICAELQFHSLIFIGAVGALKPEFLPGDICTPVFSIAGGIAHTYLKDSVRDYVPFEKITPDMEYTNAVVRLGAERGVEIKKASVFCTPSIVGEYFHLEEIRAFDTDLIEMETAAFYQMAALMEKPGIALLVVSDNSASGVPLVGRTDAEQARYDAARRKILPEMLLAIAETRGCI